MKPVRAVLIAGPTASGKSALALAVAERVGRAVIVNADSMQVYADLRVLTARPDAADEARAQHALFGHVDGADAYSVARYIDDAATVLAAAEADGLLPIVVGGTGLYFKALIEGLSPVPPIDPAIREHLRAEAARYGAAHMHERLAKVDAVMSERLVPTDTQRITRALEVIEATGRSLAEWQQLPGTPVIAPRAAACFVLSPPRETLMCRCDDRFDLMMRSGVLDEVAALRVRKLSPDLPVMRALGVAPLAEFLAGSVPREAAVERAKADTRQFAKRQLTWLRRHMLAWNKVHSQETERIAAEIISNIDFAG